MRISAVKKEVGLKRKNKSLIGIFFFKSLDVCYSETIQRFKLERNPEGPKKCVIQSHEDPLISYRTERILSDTIQREIIELPAWQAAENGELEVQVAILRIRSSTPPLRIKLLASSVGDLLAICGICWCFSSLVLSSSDEGKTDFGIVLY